jgi:hypothetical protein
VGHASKQGARSRCMSHTIFILLSVLHLEVSQARVFQSSLKTGGGAAWMVHVASSWRSHRDETEVLNV